MIWPSADMELEMLHCAECGPRRDCRDCVLSLLERIRKLESALVMRNDILCRLAAECRDFTTGGNAGSWPRIEALLREVANG